jgi:hypothetical protein
MFQRLALSVALLLSLSARAADFAGSGDTFYPWHLKDPVPPVSTVDPVPARDDGVFPICLASDPDCDEPGPTPELVAIDEQSHP